MTQQAQCGAAAGKRGRCDAAATKPTILGDERGFASVVVAGTLTVVLGFVGLAVDVSHWYAQRRVTQSIADAAAVAATHARLESGDDLAAIRQVATQAAKLAGFDETASHNRLDVSLASGATGGGAQASVTVSVRREVPVFFARLFLPDGHTVAARAVGGLRSAADGDDSICVLALDEADTALTFIGNTTARIGCVVASNSRAGTGCAGGGTCPPALLATGSADITASRLQAVGRIDKQGSAVVRGEIRGSSWPPVADPYAARTLPVPAGCDIAGGLSVNSSGIALNCAGGAPCIAPPTPGGDLRICGGLDIKRAVTLKPGRYFIKGGGLSMNAQAKVTGSGVTLIMAESSPGANDLGKVMINGQAEVALSAPTTGEYAGIVFYQDRGARQSTPPADNKFNGGADLKLGGALYLPNGSIEFLGGADSVGCTQIIAKTIKFTGNSTIVVNDACLGTGVTSIPAAVQHDVVLVE